MEDSGRARRSFATSAQGTALLALLFVAGFLVFAVWSGSWYGTWKALHVLAAIIWIGGALMIQIYAFVILRERDPHRMAWFSRATEKIGMRTFLPSSLILVVLGFVLVQQAGWAWKFWLVFGLVLWAASFVNGAAFIGPESGRIAALIEERGGVDDVVHARIERILLASRVEAVILALVAMDMVLKPGA